MKNFADMIGNNIKLNIDAETENREGEKVNSGFNIEVIEGEGKIGTMVYMPKTFRRDFDKFIKRYGNVRGGRSEIICKMLQYAMEVIERENNIK